MASKKNLEKNLETDLRVGLCVGDRIMFTEYDAVRRATVILVEEQPIEDKFYVVARVDKNNFWDKEVLTEINRFTRFAKLQEE